MPEAVKGRVSKAAPREKPARIDTDPGGHSPYFLLGIDPPNQDRQPRLHHQRAPRKSKSASRIRGPPMPKNFAPVRARSAVASRAAYISLDASPAEINTRRSLIEPARTCRANNFQWTEAVAHKC